MNVSGKLPKRRRRGSGISGGAAILAAGLFLSCKVPDRLWVDYGSFPEPERSALAAILTPAGPEKPEFTPGTGTEPGTIRLRYERRFITWEESGAEIFSGSGVFFPLSRTAMVPCGEVWEGKNGIDPKAAALSGWETEANRGGTPWKLIPLRDLAPPYVAFKAGGLNVSDPQYPLVLTGGLLFEYDGENLQGAKRRRIEKKIAGLARLVTEACKDRGEPYEERPRLYRIAAGGDAMLARGVEELLFAQGPEAVLGETAAFIKGADLSLINLEGAVTDRGEQAANKTYTFRFKPRTAAALKDAGIDAALIANNHAFDFGLRGFLDTLDHLKGAGIAPLGGGPDSAAAAAPFVTGEGALPVRVFGIASFGRERTGWDGLAFAADVKNPGILHAGRGGAGLIKTLMQNDPGLDIVLFHGGIEYSDYPDEETRNLYTDLIAAGADLVIGTHPHVEQGFEWVRGKPVFWSLGDYVFNEMDDTPGGDKGLFIVLWFLIPSGGEKTRLVYMDPYPVFMNRERTVLLPDRQLERFYRLTKELAGF
ncbi:MAG: CapA family protein [Spirochaetaceae bacterium]|jgi:poly-gamma-glutamate synthesis protein (capsule biosynthesis protein)|nr:CapA family protein [Spirochaetaceae bacterium]